MSIALKYAIFAALATGANIAAQDLSLAFYGGAQAIVLSVLVGTAVGLLLKYQLDKRYIFGFRPGSRVTSTTPITRFSFTLWYQSTRSPDFIAIMLLRAW